MVTPAIFSMLCDGSWGDKATCRYMYNHVLHLHHKALLAPGHPHQTSAGSGSSWLKQAYFSPFVRDEKLS